MIIEEDRELRKINQVPSYYNFIREVIGKIERDNDIKIPIKIVHKLDKRYQKMRNNHAQEIERRK